MAKKQAPKVHPGSALEALKAFHESVGYAMGSLGAVASLLERGAQTADQAKELATFIREAQAKVSAHWDYE